MRWFFNEKDDYGINLNSFSSVSLTHTMEKEPRYWITFWSDATDEFGHRRHEDIGLFPTRELAIHYLHNELEKCRR